MKTDSRFELNSSLETYDISGLMYYTYYYEVWFEQPKEGKALDKN